MAQIFIGQLPFSKFFPDDLLNLFGPYGTVVAHQLHIRQGNAFVTYATTDEADAAIRALHGQCALGTRSQPIQVMYSKGTRLISPFGLQHRSLCLARNKDRQKSKRGLSEAADAQSTSNNDSVSLNDGALSHPSDFAALPYTGNAEDKMGMSGAGVASFYSRGPSDVSFDEDGRAVVGCTSMYTHPTNYTVAQPTQQQQQQQSTGYLSGMMSMDAVACGTPVKWTFSPSGLVPVAATASGHHSHTRASTGRCSPLSSPAAPPLPPPSAAPASLSYLMMPPPASGMAIAGGMPICYVIPTAAGPMYLPSPHHQQQQQHPGMGAMMNPFGAAAMMPSPLTYVQMRPM